MIALNGQPGELRFTVEITRKDTGKIDRFEMVGKVGEAPKKKDAE